jgi:polyketide biosynthesis enoyl-CoA hydratase PksH
MNYQTIRVHCQEPVCFIQLHRPDKNNTINGVLIEECRSVLTACEEACKVVVLEGLKDSFCLGADLTEVSASAEGHEQDPQGLYELWRQLALGSYVSVAHVRGRVSAGGMGFVSAADIVIADDTARFGLSELLFGLCPACVWPFLVRRVGFQRAQYLALSTRSISAEQGLVWGLVDIHERQEGQALQREITRLKCLPKDAIRRYKRYMGEVDDLITRIKPIALRTSQAAFLDPDNVFRIRRYVEKGLYPWEA